VTRPILTVAAGAAVMLAASHAAAAEGKAGASAVGALARCLFESSLLATLVPAFFLAALIKVLLPAPRVLRHLSSGAPWPRAYGAAAGSGVLLSLCPCNIVSLFSSVRRSGAGSGPAFAMLYAGPAVNLVAMVYAFKLLGPRMGLWRLLAAGVMAPALAVTMCRLFPARESPAGNTTAVYDRERTSAPAVALIALLAAAVALGFVPMSDAGRLATLGAAGIVASLLAAFGLDGDSLRLWLREAAATMLRTLLVLTAATAAFGFLAGLFRLDAATWSGAAAGVAAAVGGTLMYFPLLTDAALVGTLEWAAGPAMVLLLAGPALSLPGLWAVRREIGTRAAACYAALSAAFAFLLGMPYAYL